MPLNILKKLSISYRLICIEYDIQEIHTKLSKLLRTKILDKSNADLLDIPEFLVLTKLLDSIDNSLKIISPYQVKNQASPHEI